MSKQSRKTKDKKNKNSPRKAIVRIFIVITIFTLGSVLYINRENLSPNNIVEVVQEFLAGSGSGGGFPVEIGKNSAIQLKNINKNIALLNNTSFVMLSDLGKELINRQHRFNNPRMKVNKRKVLIYDCGAKGIVLESRAKSQIPFEVNNNIIAAGIGLDGTIAVATESNKYLSEMTVYSQDFFSDSYKQIFKYNSSEYYIIDVSLNPDGKGAAVAAVSASEGQIRSCVLVFDFNNSEPVCKQEFIGTMLLSIWYTDNTIFAVGDNLICSIKADGSVIEKLDYKGSNLTGLYFDNTSGMTLALSSSSDLSNSLFYSYDAKGNIISSAEIKDTVRSIASNSNYSIVLTPSHLLIYDKACNLIKQIECESDVYSITISGNYVIALGKKEIRQISIK